MGARTRNSSESTVFDFDFAVEAQSSRDYTGSNSAVGGNHSESVRTSIAIAGKPTVRAFNHDRGSIELDYADQSLAIHRRSVPEYVADDGDVRFRHENIVERPRVSSDEPLRRQLASFLEVVASNGTPRVSIEDGLAALEIVHQIETSERIGTTAARGEVAHE